MENQHSVASEQPWHVVEKQFSDEDPRVRVHVVKVGGKEPEHSLAEDCWCDPKIERYTNGNVLVSHNPLQ